MIKKLGYLIFQAIGQMVYCFLWLLGAIVFYLPFSFKKCIASFLSYLWFYFVGFRKRIILHNLILVFPRAQGESMPAYKSRLSILCRKNMAHYCLSFLETLERFHWTPEIVERRVDVVHHERLQAFVKAGQGFFILTSHIGNWELMTLVGVRLGVRLAVITKFLRNPFWDQIWVKSRQAFGLELLNERQSGLQVARSIQKGKAVGFILDQHTGKPHGLESTFLGHKAMTAKGLAILSHRLKAPVLPGYFIRNEDGRFTLYVEEAFWSHQVIPEKFCNESGPLSDEALGFHLRKCNEIMERWSYLHPEQYLWIHKRFKNFLNYGDPLPW